MLNQPTIEKLYTMKLNGMADAFQAQMETTDVSIFSRVSVWSPDSHSATTRSILPRAF